MSENEWVKFAQKIKEKSAGIGVIGLGYVGLPLAVEFAKAGFKVTGIDTDAKKVDAVNAGRSHVADVDSETVRSLVRSGHLRAARDYSVLSDIDAVSICVPTPLRKTKEPDLSYIIGAVEGIKPYLHRHQLIILESTTYPGTTDEVVVPLLEDESFKAGRDFFLAFSPERIDPGNKTHHVKNTPKIVGGITPQCTEVAKSLYESIIDTVVPVSSTKAAEMVKLLENTFRAINIGLANEIAIMCNHLGINTWEVIEAAATKPFGFMPFYPGPGLGGHCIPVDPHYLRWKLTSMNYHARFIQVADEINSSMPRLVADKVVAALNSQKKSVKGCRILVLGVAYKKDVDDCRESPALDIIHLLQEKGGIVSYNDPHIPTVAVGGADFASVPLSTVRDHDCVVLLTNHSCYDMEKIVRESRLLVDTRNATKGIAGFAEKIFKI